jgi:hypothetical protein
MSLVLNVEILGEFKNLTAATKGAQTQLQQMSAKANKVSAGIGKAFAAIGVGFSLGIITRELEQAAKAAVEDVKSQTLLANQMRNTTAATDDQIKSVEKQIGKLQLSASVADDKLRPAYATLLRTTKNTTEAMSLLNLATDVSAGSGKDLTAVTMALSKAYQGKMAALTKLGIPMSDSIQNASDYAKEMTKLNKLQTEAAQSTGPEHAKAMAKVAEQQDLVNRIAADGIDWQNDLAKAFAGSAKAAANTDPYQRMQIIFGEMQEQIGTALLPLLDEFSTWLATPEGQKKLGQIVELIKDVIGQFTAMAKWVLDNKDWLLPMISAVGGLKLAWEGVTGAIKAAEAASAIFGAIGAVGAGVAGAIGAIGVGSAVGSFQQGQTAGQTAQIYSQSDIFKNIKPAAKSPTVVQQINIKGTQTAQQIAQTLNKSLKASGSTTIIRGGR